jgi:hypothetical protein
MNAGIAKNKWISLENGFCLLFIGYGVVYTLLRLFGPGFDRIPGDLADSRFNNYLLEHGYRYITGLDVSFWDAPFNFPESNVLAFSDNFIGQLPFYSAFRFLGLSRESAYQGWLALSYLLNFSLCAWVFYKLSANKPAALIGAYIFAFSVAILDQSNHTQMTARYPIPLAFYFLLRFFHEPRHRTLLFLLIAILIQFLNSIYLGFLLSLSLFCFFLIYLVLYWKVIPFRSFFKIRQILFSLIWLGLTATVLGYFFRPYLDHLNQGNFSPSKADVFDSLPWIRSYFLSSPNSLSWPFLSTPPEGLKNFWNHWMFPGGFVYASILVLSGILLFKRKAEAFQLKSSWLRLSAVMLGALTLLVLCTLHTHNFTLYEYIYPVPGFSSMRDLCRVMNVEFFFYAAIASSVVTYLEGLIQKPKMKQALWVLCMLLLLIDARFDFEGVGTYSKLEARQLSSQLASQIRCHPHFKTGAAVAYIPHTDREQPLVHLDAMMACQEAGIPTVNAYTATCPEWYCDFAAHHNLDALKEWLEHSNFPLDTTRIILIR